ncbi:hypothetical protein ACFQFQ_12530 [Sulfitobacter porphyrae]|uniref:Methylamine utilization protein MauE n=1 Tax=Sulfitobacter porphyrae TaxID=1246864 RepID=A0ABW2B3K1_9RHOB
MKSLLKVMLILGGLFALTFVAGRLLGILTVENVQALLEWAQRVDPAIVFGLVVLLLFADLFVAVLALTITILAGVLIGFPAGAAAAITGMSLAAGTGYWISRVRGQKGCPVGQGCGGACLPDQDFSGKRPGDDPAVTRGTDHPGSHGLHGGRDKDAFRAVWRFLCNRHAALGSGPINSICSAAISRNFNGLGRAANSGSICKRPKTLK